MIGVGGIALNVRQVTQFLWLYLSVERSFKKAFRCCTGLRMYSTSWWSLFWCDSIRKLRTSGSRETKKVGGLVSKYITKRCFIRPVERRRPQGPKNSEWLAMLLFFSNYLPSPRVCISLRKEHFWDKNQNFILSCSRSGTVRIKGCSLSPGTESLQKPSIYATMRKCLVKEMHFFQSRIARFPSKLLLTRVVYFLRR